MPLYEYRCQRCQGVFEVIQKFSDEPLTVHDNCGGAVERLISAPALQFKGTGWYITDYARAGKNGQSGKEGGEKTTGDKQAKESSSGSSEAKPESKSESKPAPASAPASDKK